MNEGSVDEIHVYFNRLHIVHESMHFLCKHSDILVCVNSPFVALKQSAETFNIIIHPHLMRAGALCPKSSPCSIYTIAETA